MRTLGGISLAFLAASVVVAVSWQVHAETNRVQFPNLAELVHYTTVRRGEVTEHIMTTPAAMEAVKAGQDVPAGTHFVLVDYRMRESLLGRNRVHTATSPSPFISA